MIRSWDKSVVCFWSQTIPVTETGCVIWLGNDDGNGRYGRFKISGRTRSAHRFAWELIHGPIPQGMNVLHKCDVSMCVNSNHLFLGTQKDNMIDCISKGRFKSNLHENNPRSVLKRTDVEKIRLLFVSGKFTKANLARQFHISESQLYRIVNNQLWVF